MKGQIRWFDTQKGDTLGEGGIDGVNGKQYEFHISDWDSHLYGGLPAPGMKVVFNVEGAHARKIHIDDRVWEVVRQFPGPVTLYPSWRVRAQWIAMLFFVGLLAVGGVFGILRHDAIGWVTEIAALVLAIVPALSLYVPDYTLRLDKDGFEVRRYFQRRRVAWHPSLLPEIHPDDNKENLRKFMVLATPDNYGFNSWDRLRIMLDWCLEAVTGPAEEDSDEEKHETVAPPAVSTRGRQFSN